MPVENINELCSGVLRGSSELQMKQQIYISRLTLSEILSEICLRLTVRLVE